GSDKDARSLPLSDAVVLQAKPDRAKIEHPGKYKVTLDLSVRGSMEATSHTAKLVLTVDGKDVQTADLGWDNRRSIKVSTEVDLAAGEHQFGLRLEPGAPPQEGENHLTARVDNV